MCALSNNCAYWLVTYRNKMLIIKLHFFSSLTALSVDKSLQCSESFLNDSPVAELNIWDNFRCKQKILPFNRPRHQTINSPDFTFNDSKYD